MRYIVEMVPPSREREKTAACFQKFADQFTYIMDHGGVASISDNVIGTEHYAIDEMMEELHLEIEENQIICHLTTSHSREELDRILCYCKQKNIRHILCLTGDDSAVLWKLQRRELGGEGDEKAGSVDLIRYIKRNYPSLIPGAAYNPYKERDEENDLLSEKIAAGAEFIITQPILGKNERVDWIKEKYPEIPIVIGVWMSNNMDILSFITGGKVIEWEEDRIDALHSIQSMYPDSSVYLAMLGQKEMELLFP